MFSHLVSFAILSAVGALIAIQRGVDGSPLTGGFLGLHIALWLCVAGQVWTLARAFGLVLTVEDRL